MKKATLQKRRHLIGVRLNDTELKKVNALAKLWGVHVQDVIRRLITESEAK
jgi:hypothetical protein